MTTRKERTRKIYIKTLNDWTKYFWDFIQDLYQEQDEGYLYPDPDLICNYLLLSVNINLSWEIIKNNQHQDWYIGHISKNPCITWEIIQNNPEINWDYHNISRNPNITWEIIQNNPDIDWSWNYVAENPNITWEIIQTNSDKLSSGWNLSRNPNITWEIIQNNPQINWDYSQLSNHPNITWDIVKDSGNDKMWHWGYLSMNPNITWDIVKDNPDKDCYSYLSMNPNITWEIIKENSHLPWDYTWVIENPNLTLNDTTSPEFFTSSEFYDINWDNVCCNKFTKEKELFIIQNIKSIYRLIEFNNGGSKLQ